MSVTQYWLAEGQGVFTIFFSNLVGMRAVLGFEAPARRAARSGLRSHAAAWARACLRKVSALP